MLSPEIMQMSKLYPTSSSNQMQISDAWMYPKSIMFWLILILIGTFIYKNSIK